MLETTSLLLLAFSTAFAVACVHVSNQKEGQCAVYALTGSEQLAYVPELQIRL